MRDNSSDKTIERNFMQKWRFLIKEYELVKAKQHPQFRYLQDFYAFHGTSRQTFAKYYNRFLQLGSDDALLPRKRDPKWKTRRTLPYIEQKVLEQRRQGINRYESYAILKPVLKAHTPSPSTFYAISKRHGLNRLTPAMKQAKRTIIKTRAGELGHLDCHYLSRDLLLDSSQRYYLVSVLDACTRLAWAEVVAVDGSFLALSAACSPWSVHRGHEAGVRVQMAYAVGMQVPTRLQVTLANVNDVTAFKGWELTPWRGWTVLLDLGYYAHRVFAQMRAGGVHFVTRLHPQAAYRVVRERALTGERTPEGDVVVRDAVIVLGSAHNRNGAVLAAMRLVVSRTAQGKTHACITDRHDLSATDVVRLYRKRWQIELFFRWLKHVLGAIRPFGHSRAAVQLTLIVASIVAVRAQLLEPLRPRGISRVCWLRVLAVTLLSALRFSG